MTLYKDLGRNQVDSYGENRRNRTIKDHRRRAGWRHPMELYTVGQPSVNVAYDCPGDVETASSSRR